MQEKLHEPPGKKRFYEEVGAAAIDIPGGLGQVWVPGERVVLGREAGVQVRLAILQARADSGTYYFLRGSLRRPVVEMALCLAHRV